MSDTYMVPLGDRIIVEREPRITQSPGGIHFPSSIAAGTSELSKGTVVATGPGRHNIYGVRIPNSVAVGDVILFDSRAGRSYKDTDVPDKDFVIINEEEVLTIFRTQ